MNFGGKAPALTLLCLNNSIKQGLLLPSRSNFSLFHIVENLLNKENTHGKKETGYGTKPYIEKSEVLRLKICNKGQKFSQSLNCHKYKSKGY